MDVPTPVATARTPTCVSVVVPARNGLPLIAEQLQALSEQDYKGAWEVVVSDNGSTDGLRQYLATNSLARQLDVRWVDSSDLRGAAHARNVGVAHARGDLIVFADHDDRVRPGWISALVRAVGAYDAATGAVATDTINQPAIVAWRPHLPEPEQGWKGPNWLPTALGGNLGVWRYAHDAIGGWDESFLQGGEDNDYAWRLQLAGFTLGHTVDAVIDYRLRDTHRELWKQMYRRGQGDVRNHVKHRGNGFRGYSQTLLFPLAVVTLLARNPLLPPSLTRLSTGKWIFYSAYAAGKVRGSIRHRVLCL